MISETIQSGRIWALMEDGREQLVPYVAAGYGLYGRKLPAGPAYFGPAPATELPGPERVEAARFGPSGMVGRELLRYAC